MDLDSPLNSFLRSDKKPHLAKCEQALETIERMRRMQVQFEGFLQFKVAATIKKLHGSVSTAENRSQVQGSLNNTLKLSSLVGVWKDSWCTPVISRSAIEQLEAREQALASGSLFTSSWRKLFMSPRVTNRTSSFVSLFTVPSKRD